MIRRLFIGTVCFMSLGAFLIYSSLRDFISFSGALKISLIPSLILSVAVEILARISKEDES